MHASLKIKVNSIFLVTFGLMFFLSTGAVVDLLVAGAEARQGLEVKQSGQLRMLLWLPVYLLALVFVFRHLNPIFAFLFKEKTILILMSIVLFSALWAESFTKSIYSSSQLCIITLFCIAAIKTFPIEKLLNVIYVVLQIIIVMSLIGIVLLPEYGVSFYNNERAFRGVFLEKNKLGQVLVYYFVMTFALRKFNVMSNSVFLISCFILLGNRSATALVLSLFLPCLYFSTNFAYGNARSVNLNLLLILFLIFLFLSGLLFIYEPLLNLLGKDPTLTGRTDLWQLGIKAFADKPIVGYGYNSFWISESAFGGNQIRALLTWGPMSMHNSWFEISLQIGLLGFSLFLFFFLKSLKYSILFINISGKSHISRCLFLLLIIFFVWSLMQNIVLRHQEFNHILLTVIAAYLVSETKLKVIEMRASHNA